MFVKKVLPGFILITFLFYWFCNFAFWNVGYFVPCVLFPESSAQNIKTLPIFQEIERTEIQWNIDTNQCGQNSPSIIFYIKDHIERDFLKEKLKTPFFYKGIPYKIQNI